MLAVLAILGLCTIMDYLWLKATWDIPEISGGDSKRLDAIKKVFTNITKKQTEYLWTNKYSSPIYQNAFGKVKKAFPVGESLK